MAQLSINETTTFRWSFEEDVVRYASLGIGAIGVWRHKLSDCGLARACEILAQYNMKVSNLSWAGGFTGSDGRSFRESIADAIEAIRASAELGSSVLVLFSGARAGHTQNHARRLLINALQELIPLAEELNVDLAIEPMHPGCAEEWTFLTNLEDTLEILQKTGSSRARLVLDTYHLGFDRKLIENIPAIIDRIALVQLGDATRPPVGEQNRCRLGEGVIPLVDIIAALRTAGYDGYYDVELLGEEVESQNYASLLEHTKKAFTTLLGKPESVT